MTANQVAEPTIAPGPCRSRHELIELDVTGMTCGSCVARVQSALGSTPGVAEATVNFATSRVTVDVASSSIHAQQLVDVVERIGYGARPVQPSAQSPADAVAKLEAIEAPERAGWLRRMLVAAPLAAAVVILTTPSRTT
jgi:copper chaperone CopZ